MREQQETAWFAAKVHCNSFIRRGLLCFGVEARRKQTDRHFQILVDTQKHVITILFTDFYELGKITRQRKMYERNVAFDHAVCGLVYFSAAAHNPNASIDWIQYCNQHLTELWLLMDVYQVEQS